MDPLVHQDELHKLAVEHGHWLVAINSYTNGPIREIRKIRAIAEAHGTTPFDVNPAWCSGT